MRDKRIEIAKKIKELAHRGILGEKESAEAKLEEYCKRYSISESDLEDRCVKTRKIRFTNNTKFLAIQILYSILGNRFEWSGTSLKSVERYFDCTDAEFIEYEIKFDFYTELYFQELDIFKKAFIQQNNIFGGNDNIELPKMTPQEVQKARRVLDMAKNIKASSPAMRIG